LMSCARKTPSFFASDDVSPRTSLALIDPGEQQPVYCLFALNAVFRSARLVIPSRRIAERSAAGISEIQLG
jgi:hypothetical protein